MARLADSGTAQPASSRCLDERELAIVCSGGLRDDEPLAARIEAHLDGCPRCRRALSTLLRLERPSPGHDRIRCSGERVGRYLLLRVLGRGGMGAVWHARDPELGRDVALKLVSEPDPDRAQRQILAEARAQARIVDDHVVRIFDVGTTGSELYIAMALIDGSDLRTWLSTRRRAWREILGVVLDAAAGLAAAHTAGVIHGDVKPGNIMIERDGSAKIADFGLARVRGHEGVTTPALDARASPHTASASMAGGTPEYAAPELMTGASADPHSDQYALCVTLHEALFGHRPGASRSLPPALDVERIPPRVVSALRRGLAEDPRARHADVASLIDGMRRAGVSPTRRRVIVTLAVSSAMVVAAVAARPAPAPCDADSVARPDAQAYARASEALRARNWSSATVAQVTAAIAHGVDHAHARLLEICEAPSGDGVDRTSEQACLTARIVGAGAMLQALAVDDSATVDVDDLLARDAPSCRSTHARIDRGERVAAAWRAFEEAGNLRALGNERAAYHAMLAAEELARTSGDEILVVSVMLERAKLQTLLADAVGALAAVETAMATAERIDATALVASARLSWIWITATALGRTRDALAELPGAAAAVERSGDARLRERLHRSAATVKMLRGDSDGAELELAALAALLDRRDATALERVALDSARGRLWIRSDPARALVELDRAVAVLEDALGPTHPRLGAVLADRGLAHAQLGALETALLDYRRADELQSHLSPGARAQLQVQIAGVLRALGRHDESVPIARAVVELCEADADADSTGKRRATAWSTLGYALVDAGRPQDGIDALARARTLFEVANGSDSLEVAQVELASAAAHRQLGDVGRASAELTHAAAQLARSLGPEHPLARHAAAELADLDGATRSP